MSFNHPKAGPNLVGAYQMSGIPFVTSSVASEVPGPDDDTQSLPIKVEFPYVTKFITVRNTGINELRVGFSADGMVGPGERLGSADADKHPNGTRNYFLIPSASSTAGVAADGPVHGSAGTIQTFDVRCKEIYFLSDVPKNNTPAAAGLSTSFSLIAGLTPILASEFPALTGSSGFTGVG